MQKVILDGKQIKTELDFHKALNSAFDFGPYYGNNLNALWDLLTTDVERPCEIIWINFQFSKNSIGERIEELVATLNEAVQKDLENPPDKRLVFKIES